MSSSHIPNLLSLRRGTRSRARGGGRGQGHTGSNAASRHDQTVQSTDTDAAVSRLSAVSLSYLHDPFAQYFVEGPGTRRLPIINRGVCWNCLSTLPPLTSTGTYTRTSTLDTLVDAFLSLPGASKQTKQVISLGAGTDTRYFRLRALNKHHNLLYHEVDFPSVCAAKHRIVEAHIQILAEESIFPDSGSTNADSEREWGILQAVNGEPQPRYICHPLDLRQLPSLESAPSFRGLRTDVPTLIISECCLCYLEVDTATDVVKWFANKIPELGIVLYEPIGPDDAFGQMMTENLAARGITMPTVQRYRGLAEQRERLAALGFREGDGGGGNDAKSIEHIWDNWVTNEERERVDSLEGLDEVEEWQMLARHYAVVWGWKGRTSWGLG
jgi:[phosphatase 2A protein]-leucine-carboxy methyltransferase